MLPSAAAAVAAAVEQRRRQPATSDRLMREAVTDAQKAAGKADERLRGALNVAIASSAVDEEEGDGYMAAVDGAAGTVVEPTVAVTLEHLENEASATVPALICLVEVLLASAEHHHARARPLKAEAAARDALEKSLELERLLTAAGAVPVDKSGRSAEIARAAQLGTAVDNTLGQIPGSRLHNSGRQALLDAKPSHQEVHASGRAENAFAEQQHRWRVGLWASTAHAHLTVCAVCSSSKRHADALTHALNAQRRLRRGLMAEGFGDIMTERERPSPPNSLVRRFKRQDSRAKAKKRQKQQHRRLESVGSRPSLVSSSGRDSPSSIGDGASSITGRSVGHQRVGHQSRTSGGGGSASVLSFGAGASASKAGSTVMSVQILPGSGGYIGSEDAAGRSVGEIAVGGQLGGLYGAACFNGATQYEYMQRFWAAKKLYASGLHVVLRCCGEDHELVKPLVLALQSLHFAHTPVAGPDSALAESGLSRSEAAKEFLEFDEDAEAAETGTLDVDRGASIPMSNAGTVSKYIERSRFASDVAAGRHTERPSSRLVSRGPSVAKQRQMALAAEALADEWGQPPSSAATQDRVMVAAADSSLRALEAATTLARKAPDRLALPEPRGVQATLGDAASESDDDQTITPTANTATTPPGGNSDATTDIVDGRGTTQQTVPRGPLKVPYRLGMDPPGIGLSGGVPTAKELRKEQQRSAARRRMRHEANRQAVIEAHDRETNAAQREADRLVEDGDVSDHDSIGGVADGEAGRIALPEGVADGEDDLSHLGDPQARDQQQPPSQAAAPSEDDRGAMPLRISARPTTSNGTQIAPVSAVSPQLSPVSDSVFQLTPRLSPSLTAMSLTPRFSERPSSAVLESLEQRSPPSPPLAGETALNERRSPHIGRALARSISPSSASSTGAARRSRNRSPSNSLNSASGKQRKSKESDRDAESTRAAAARSRASSSQSDLRAGSRRRQRGQGRGSRRQSHDAGAQGPRPGSSDEDWSSDLGSVDVDALSEASTDIGDKQAAFDAGVVAHGAGEGALAGGAPLRYDADTDSGFTTTGNDSFAIGTDLRKHKLRASRNLGQDVVGAGRDGPALPIALRKPPRTGDPMVDAEAMKMALLRRDNSADPTALKLSLSQRMARSKMTYEAGPRIGHAPPPPEESDVVRGVLAFSGARGAGVRAKKLQLAGLTDGELGPPSGRSHTPGTTPAGSRPQSGKRTGTDLVDSDEETEDLLRELQTIARFSVYDGQPAKPDEVDGPAKALGELSDFSSFFSQSTAGSDPDALTELQEAQLVVGRGRSSLSREGKRQPRKRRIRASGSRHGRSRSRGGKASSKPRERDVDATPLPLKRETQLIASDSSVHPVKPGQPTSALARARLELEQEEAAERAGVSHRMRPGTADSGGIVSDDTIAFAQQFAPTLVPMLRHGASLAKLRKRKGRGSQRIRKGVLREVQAGPSLMGSASLAAESGALTAGVAIGVSRNSKTRSRKSSSQSHQSVNNTPTYSNEDGYDDDELALFSGNRQAPQAYRPDLEAAGRANLITKAKARWEDPLQGGRAPNQSVDSNKVQGVTQTGTLDKAEPLVWWRMRSGHDTALITDYDLHRRRIAAVMKGRAPRGGRLDSPRDASLTGERLVPRDKLFTDGRGNSELLRPTLPIDITHIPGPEALVAAARAERAEAAAKRALEYTAGQRPPEHLSQEEAEAARTAAGWAILRAGAAKSDGQTYDEVLRASDAHGRLIYPRLTSTTQTLEASRRLQQDMSPRSNLGAASSARSSDASTVMTPRMRDFHPSRSEPLLPPLDADLTASSASAMAAASSTQFGTSPGSQISPVEAGGIAFSASSRSRGKAAISPPSRVLDGTKRHFSTSELEPVDSVTWRQSRRFRVHSMMVAEAGGDPELETSSMQTRAGDHFGDQGSNGAAYATSTGTGVAENEDGWGKEAGPADWHSLMMHAAKHAEAGGTGSSLAVHQSVSPIRSILKPRLHSQEDSKQHSPDHIPPDGAARKRAPRRKRVSIVLDEAEAAQVLSATVNGASARSGDDDQGKSDARLSPRVPADVLVGRLPLPLRPSMRDDAIVMDPRRLRDAATPSRAASPPNSSMKYGGAAHVDQHEDLGNSWQADGRAPSSRAGSSRQSLRSSIGVPLIGLSDSSRAPTSGLQAMGRQVVGDHTLERAAEGRGSISGLRSSLKRPGFELASVRKTTTGKRRVKKDTAVSNGLFVPRMAPRIIKRTPIPMKALMRSTL